MNSLYNEPFCLPFGPSTISGDDSLYIEINKCATDISTKINMSKFSVEFNQVTCVNKKIQNELKI